MYIPDFPSTSTRQRQLLRLQIRRKQVTTLLANHRKKPQFKLTQQQPHHLAANNQLMARSLLPNQLRQLLPKLLPALYSKIKIKPSIQNRQFVVALCSNILQDDIILEDKQFIYGMCMECMGVDNINKMSVLIQVNFYNVAIFRCYAYLDETKQMQIQKLIIPRLVQLLNLQGIDLSRTSPNYTNQQCIEQVYEGCLSAFLNYYQPQLDHNMILIYKIQRTVNIIKSIIAWYIAELPKIEKCRNYQEILLIFNAIFGNITQTPVEFHTIINDQKIWRNLIILLINQLSINNEKLTHAKIITVRVLINLFGTQTQILQNILQESTINVLLRELENSISNDYTIQLLILFTNAITGLKYQNTIIDDHIGNLLSLTKDILQKQSQQIQKSLITKCLLLIRSILTRGFELGNSEYRNLLANIGILCALDDIFVTIKDKEIEDIVDSIYYFVDLC